ncbi:MAG: family 10 glycosylhydrolase [Lachnospiraceae bacterium]|nr:family 10 glycosylhydrolase [Lachnospiraceae bacterium]
MRLPKRIAAAAAALLTGVCMAMAVPGPVYAGVQLIGPGMQAEETVTVRPDVLSDGPGAGQSGAGSEGAVSVIHVGTSQKSPGSSGTQELRGVWISYLEWQAMPKTQAEFQQAADTMLDHCVNWGMNAIFLHAHSHTDATYPSDILPWSKYVSGVQGKDPGFDPFGYFVQAAHQRGLQVHAWFNPYRVTGYQMSWDEVSDKNPAKQWLTDNDASNDRWVLFQGGQYYLNPSIPQVQELVAASVQEVLWKYDVEGIHFDDYFYPAVDDSREGSWFDKPEYDASGSTLPIADWRRENVNQLVSKVYSRVKAIKPGAVFGISPQGYLENLRSNTSMFVDIDRWMTSGGYIDYIMPQLYWGFEARTSDGSLAPYAFDQNLSSWIALKQKGTARLYLGLGMYRAGTNVSDHNEISEWLRCDDILKRQVEAGRASGQVSGCCFFSYSSFLEETSANEVANLVSILK